MQLMGSNSSQEPSQPTQTMMAPVGGTTSREQSVRCPFGATSWKMMKPSWILLEPSILCNPRSPSGAFLRLRYPQCRQNLDALCN